MWPHRWQPTRLPHPWDSPGKNTGVGFHFPLQCMKVKSESEVTQSCPTLCDPKDCSLPGSSVHGIFQARILEWVAIAFSDDITSLFLLNTEHIWKYLCIHSAVDGHLNCFRMRLWWTKLPGAFMCESFVDMFFFSLGQYLELLGHWVTKSQTQLND